LDFWGFLGLKNVKELWLFRSHFPALANTSTMSCSTYSHLSTAITRSNYRKNNEKTNQRSHTKQLSYKETDTVHCGHAKAQIIIKPPKTIGLFDLWEPKPVLSEACSIFCGCIHSNLKQIWRHKTAEFKTGLVKAGFGFDKSNWP